MAYDRIPGVDENFRFPPEVEGGVEKAMLDAATTHVQATTPNLLVRTNAQGYVTANAPFSGPQIVPKSYVDSRVPANLPITEDNSVGKRIFIGDTRVYGDTGWRDVSSLFPEINVSGAGHYEIRWKRVSDDVYFYANGVWEGGNVLGPGVMGPMLNDIFSAPTYSYSDMLGTALGDSVAGLTRLVNSGFDLRLQFNATPIVGNRIRASAVFPTRSPWPTYLPGTPA